MKALTVLEHPLPAACCVPLDAPTLSEDEASAAATVFKALGDPTRVRIVNMLANAGEGVCVCDLTPHLGLSQPTVSHHLRRLAEAGLLDREQRGTWSFYSLNAAALDQLRLLTTFAEALT